MLLPRRILIAIIVGHFIALSTYTHATDALDGPAAPAGSPRILTLDSNPQLPGIWQNHTSGTGFRAGLQEAGTSIGGSLGMNVFGTSAPHDMVLSCWHYGRMLGGLVGSEHWYRGNREFVEELFGGGQLHSSSRYLVGETTVLRYNFATGLGVAVTDIGRPDLGSTFEFNLQVGPGIRWFWRDNTALTCQLRLLHLSNAAIRDPDHGVNGSVFYVGVAWFF